MTDGRCPELKNTGIDYEKLVRNLYQQSLSLDGIENRSSPVCVSRQDGRRSLLPFRRRARSDTAVSPAARPGIHHSSSTTKRRWRKYLASRTDADMVRAAADAHRSVFVFGDVLGDGFTPLRVPLTTTLFDRVDSDTELLVDRAKAYFARPRPPGAENARVIPQRARRFCSLHGHSTLANSARETGRDISTCLDLCAKPGDCRSSLPE